MADLTAYTTSRRSLEMTFDVAASEGQDPDPDIESVCRRVMCFRRNATKVNETGRLTMENLNLYCEAGARGTVGEEGDLEDKEIGGMPTARKRMELRRQCEAEGPVGYLIESAHINAARIDQKGMMRQEGQPTIGVLGEAYQDLKKSTRENLQRNRTAAGEGYRKEHVGHVETDYYAAKGTIGKMDEEDKVILNVIRSGSTWTANTGYWAGHK